MPSYANVKGDRGERAVVKVLQAWWRQVEPDALFARTPDSGAWRTTHGAGFMAAGDVQVGRVDTPEKSRWPFSVEVKWRARVTQGVIDKFVQGTSKVANAYWAKCCHDADEAGMLPMLVMRGNRMDWWVVFQEHRQGVYLTRVCLLDEFVLHDPRLFLKKAKRRP